MGSLAAVAAASVVLAGTLATQGVADAVPGRSPRASTGSSSGSPVADSFSAVSCPTTAACVAVGQVGPASDDRSLIYAEVSGTWRSVTAPQPPGTSAAGPENDLLGVDCVSVGNCAAVGSYAERNADGTKSQQALLEVESGGTWRARTPPLPPNASATPSNALGAVACRAAGDCVAVGSYVEANGNRQALLDVETSGVWSSVSTPLPHGADAANANNALSDVSCTSPAGCVADGDYVAKVPGSSCGGGDCQLPLLVVETSGTWKATTVSLPSNATTSPATGDLLSAVACPSSRECVAVGSYADRSQDSQVLLDVETSGTWAVVSAPLPADAFPTPNTNALLAVTCASAGNCVAVGHYDGAGRFPEGLIEDDVGGTWSATTAPTPSDARPAKPDVELASVSCAPGAGCVTVGSYVTSLGDLHPRALLDAQVDGSWVAGSVELPSDASALYPYSAVADVDCASATSCVAVGLYLTTQSVSAVLLDQGSVTLAAIPVAPGAPAGVSAVAGHAQAMVSWTAPSSAGGSAITGYTATAAPGGVSCTTTGATSCRIWPLSGGKSYSFTVTAQNALASSTPSAVPVVALVLPAIRTTSTVAPFLAGSAALTSGLTARVVALSKLISPDGVVRIAVVGYSDDTAGPRQSLAISRRRALAVVAEVRHQFGRLHITPVAITVSQKGSADPVASNTSPEGRARNRRVVVTMS